MTVNPDPKTPEAGITETSHALFRIGVKFLLEAGDALG